MPRGRPKGSFYGPKTAQGTYYSRSKGKLPPKQEEHVKTLIKTNIARTLEKNQFDVYDIQNISYSGNQFNLLSGIVRGTDALDYVGDSITVKSIELRYVWDVYDTYNNMRVTLVQWRGSGTCSASTVYQLINNQQAPLSAFNSDNNNLFTVLYDRMHTGTLSSSSQTCTVHKFIKVPAKVHFKADGTFEKGALMLVVISDSSTVSHPQFQFYSRVNYND